MPRRPAIPSLAALALLSLGGCASGAGLDYSTASPPQIMIPASEAGVVDARAAFRNLFCSLRRDHGAGLPHDRPCEDALARLEGEDEQASQGTAETASMSRLRVVIVPGIFGECVAPRVLPFQDAVPHLVEAHGLPPVEWIPVDGRSGSARNAGIIRDWLAAHPTPEGQELVLVGYSKGASDLLETIGRFPDAVPAGASVVAVAGVIAGTPLADDWEHRYDAADWLPFPTCGPGDRGGVRSLTRRERMRWLADHPLPDRYRYYSLPAFAPRGDISRMLKPFHRQLSSIDARNDGQVLWHDAVFPRGVLLGYAHADHWAVTLPMAEGMPATRPLVNRNAYPRTLLLEAILRYVAADAESSRRQ